MTGTQTALIIDTDESRQELLVALKKAGFRVLEATNSGDGAKCALDNSPRIVIVAEEMTPLEGVDLLPVIRRLTDLPIIAIGSGGEMAMVQALLQGADVYLTRPVNVQEFMARIQALLRRYAIARGSAKEPLLPC